MVIIIIITFIRNFKFNIHIKPGLSRTRSLTRIDFNEH